MKMSTVMMLILNQTFKYCAINSYKFVDLICGSRFIQSLFLAIRETSFSAYVMTFPELIFETHIRKTMNVVIKILYSI